MSKNHVIFHAKPFVTPEAQEQLEVRDKQGNLTGEVIPVGPTATHTLAFIPFHKEVVIQGDQICSAKNALIMGWSLPNHNENWNRKLGSKYALSKVDQSLNRLMNETFANRAIHIVESLVGHLPKTIMGFFNENNEIVGGNFDYYLRRAIREFLHINELDNVIVFFRSMKRESKQCAISYDAKLLSEQIEIEDDMRAVNARREAEKVTSDCIFAINAKGEVVVQDRETYYAQGFKEIDNTTPNIIIDKLKACKNVAATIRVMINAVYAYDMNLHNQINDLEE